MRCCSAVVRGWMDISGSLYFYPMLFSVLDRALGHSNRNIIIITSLIALSSWDC